MPNKLKYILPVLLLFLLLSPADAQEKLQLDFNTLLEMARVDNPTLQMIQLQKEKAEAELKLKKKWGLPDLMLGANAHQLWGNVLNSDGRIFMDVNRQSFGGQIGFNALIDLQEGPKNKKLKEYELRSKSFQGRIARNDYVLELIGVYYQLLAAQQEKGAYQNLVLQSDSIIGQLELLVREGLQYNTDLLLAKSNRENHYYQYQEAALAALDSEASLLALLYQNPDTEIELTETEMLPIELISDDDDEKSDPTFNPHFKLLQNEQAAKAYEYKKEKSALLLPKINLSAYTGIFGDVFFDIAPTSALNGGLVWQIPMSRLSGDEVEILEIEKKILDTQMNRMSSEMKHRIRKYRQQLASIKMQIQSTESAIKNAFTALDETIQRQELGLSRAFEIEQAQEAYIRSRINYLKAVGRYNVLQYHLWVEMGNDL